jgi:cytochrome c-type biogenesis protein CcmH
LWLALAVMAALAAAFIVPALVRGAGPQHALAVWLVAGVLAAAVGLYLWLGDPAAADGRRAALSQHLAAADVPGGAPAGAGAYQELERHLARQPRDARALVLKARLDMQERRFELAAAAYQRALEGPTQVSTDAGVWVEYAEARGMLQGGRLSGQPQQLVDKALLLNPLHPQALDLAGSAAWEQGDFAAAVAHWSRLLAQLPPGTARHQELSSAIARAQQRARFALPPAR